MYIHHPLPLPSPSPPISSSSNPINDVFMYAHTHKFLGYTVGGNTRQKYTCIHLSTIHLFVYLSIYILIYTIHNCKRFKFFLYTQLQDMHFILIYTTARDEFLLYIHTCKRLIFFLYTQLQAIHFLLTQLQEMHFLDLPIHVHTHTHTH